MTNIKKNKFFISYTLYLKNYDIVFDNCFLYTDKSLLSQYQIKEIEQELKKDRDASLVKIMNFIKIMNDK